MRNVTAALVRPNRLNLANQSHFQKRTLAIVIFISLLLTVSAAQSGPTDRPKVARKDAQALAAITHAMTKMGGAFPVMTSEVQAETTFADGRVTTATIKTLGRDHIRTDGFINGKQESSLLRKGHGKKSIDGSEEKVPRWITKYVTADHIPSLSRLADVNDPSFNFEYGGLENVGNRPAHRIRSTALPKNKQEERFEKDISQVDVLIDAESSLLLKTEKWSFSPHAIQNRSKVEIFYEDYRAVDGVLIPHRQRWVVSGQPFATLTLSNVQLNLPISAADFD